MAAEEPFDAKMIDAGCRFLFAALGELLTEGSKRELVATALEAKRAVEGRQGVRGPAGGGPPRS